MLERRDMASLREFGYEIFPQFGPRHGILVCITFDCLSGPSEIVSCCDFITPTANNANTLTLRVKFYDNINSDTLRVRIGV